MRAGYDPTVDGRVPNEFATAAFRLGHTLLQEKIQKVSKYDEADSSLFLSEVIVVNCNIYIGKE